VTPRRPAPRRKPFAAIRKGIVGHVLSGRLKGARFATYLWLHLQADHTTGTVWTNATKICLEIGFHPVVIRRELEALRREGYLRYGGTRGSRQLYEITIEKYHEHFEDESGELQGELHGQLHDELHGGLQERSVSSGNGGANAAPKNKEEERPQETPAPLRGVRFADSTGTEDVSLTRSDALARAPEPARQALASFFVVTGREAISGDDFAYFARLDQAHTPAVIGKGISAAAARFAKRGQPSGELTLQYVWESLKHFTTRQPPEPGHGRTTGARTNAAPGGSAHPKYPPGVTRLRW
jgi:hypothetical protein